MQESHHGREVRIIGHGGVRRRRAERKEKYEGEEEFFHIPIYIVSGAAQAVCAAVVPTGVALLMSTWYHGFTSGFGLASQEAKRKSSQSMSLTAFRIFSNTDNSRDSIFRTSRRVSITRI
jgi:hypothetical protein